MHYQSVFNVINTMYVYQPSKKEEIKCSSRENDGLNVNIFVQACWYEWTDAFFHWCTRARAILSDVPVQINSPTLSILLYFILYFFSFFVKAMKSSNDFIVSLFQLFYSTYCLQFYFTVYFFYTRHRVNNSLSPCEDNNQEDEEMTRVLCPGSGLAALGLS